MAKTVYLEQLGCPKNEVDGEHLLGALRRAGFERSTAPAGSDVLLVNTCGFIDPAKEESIERILRLARLKGDRGRLLVAGCLAQRYARQLLEQIPEIDALVGVDRLDDVVDAARGEAAGNCFVARPAQAYSESAAPRQRPDRPWAYLKVSDGCDNACAFCAIPQFRGRNRSRRYETILAEARSLAAAGVRELVVVAQDTTSYGQDLYGRRRIAELLPALGQIDGIEWVRLMYAFPRFVSRELIAVLASEPHVVPYLDLPIQHIDDELLGQMNRGLDGRGTRALLERIRGDHPEIALRTSVIVGHPTESAEAFARLADFVADFEFDRLGVFTYSEEAGTRASHLEPKVDTATAELRRRLLLDLQADILARRQDAQIGRILPVLVEARGDDRHWGRTTADAPEVDCAVSVGGAARVGEVLQVRCTGTLGVDLVGTVEPV
jgi:ribosomal protein S12 methylthiotransferase